MFEQQQKIKIIRNMKIIKLYVYPTFAHVLNIFYI